MAAAAASRGRIDKMLDKPRESSDEEEDTDGDDMGTDGEAWAKRAVRRME